MLHFVIFIEGAWDRHHRYDNQFFSKIFCVMSCSFRFKVSNDLQKYLPRYSIFMDCLESDLHHMTSQILSILIDFIQDRAFFVPFFRSFYKSLNINNSGTRNDIKKW